MDYGGKQLGEVAARLVELEFKDDIDDADAKQLGQLVRLARALHTGIATKLRREEETEVEDGACSGPCMTVPLVAKPQLRALLSTLHSHASPQDVHRAYKALRATVDFSRTGRGRRLCELVGQPCAALEKGYTVELLRALAEEARRTVAYAEHVSQAYLLRLEAREQTLSLSGGGTIFQTRLALLRADPVVFRKTAKQFYVKEVPDVCGGMASAVDSLASPDDVLTPLLTRVHPSHRAAISAAYEQRWRDFLTASNLYAYTS